MFGDFTGKVLDKKALRGQNGRGKLELRSNVLDIYW